MKIVLSRKGFDSSFGGGPSPIIDGRPISLPIPGTHGEATTYEELGLAELAAECARGKWKGTPHCHDDPMFDDSHGWLGQVGAAQGHLRKQGVGPGDVFVFFGLFADRETRERHHRIFAYMEVIASGTPEEIVEHPEWREPPRPHPHFSGNWPGDNAIWFGKAHVASHASDALRLTAPDTRRWSRWHAPDWMQFHRPTYLKGDWRWLDSRTLDTRGIWQEGVCDVGDEILPRQWLDRVIAEIER